MSSYTITNKKLDKNKVFILQKSELEKRFDPQYYQVEYKNIVNKLKEKKHIKLGEIVKFSKETWNQKDFFNDTFPYIEISEIDTLSGEIQNISNIELSNAASRAKMIVRENDIIVSTTRPNRGAIALIKKEQDFSIASTGFCVIRNSEIDKNYLFAILKQNFILKQFEQRSSGGNYPAITQEELSSVIIPIANDNNQIKIKTIFQQCFKQKKINEEKAEKLLENIDDYLLKELGITLPEKQVNTLKNRMFTTSISELSGSRFDPYFNSQEFSSLDKIMENEIFIKFSTIIDVITKGETPLWKGEEYVENGIPFLKVQNISIDGIKGKLTYISEELHKSMKRSILRGGELLYTMAGSIGIATLLPADFGEANINQAIAKIVFKENIKLDKDYLLYVLNSIICRKQAERHLTVSAQPNINFEQIKSIKIPVPNIEKQNEIAEHISAIRKQAQDLKDQTKLLLEKANKEIEDILLNT
jgi:restriction endonuclease S subunit